MSETYVERCLIENNKRLERALRKERDIDQRLMDLLQKGMRAEAVEVLAKHLREVGELDRG
ncbi:hypothetical protein GCM10011348_46110 [Marinobacterium nitratireducens]|uniref:Uncharacterized protein n=1 Tax=Marinobacterium nitratireducens TaxID=518897 RepID=A0A918DXT8_9GAMM|nr:hypothetical protein [Marinobacterium nitratireducens]GGO89115.1 hypothetical protein GCM10011348_46110 [Marinobacterium nitratireducens]